MTAPKSTTRRRRSGSSASVPPTLARWFGGEVFARRPMFFAMSYGWQVAEQWRAWVVDHPGAVPPAGWEWLADPADHRHRRPAHLRTA